VRRALSGARAWPAIPLLIFAGGCPGSNVDPGQLSRALTRLKFTMGHRGEGFISFVASSPGNLSQPGECRDAICNTTVDFETTLTLTPVPATGFRFMAWVGDPAAGLDCPVVTSVVLSGIVAVKVERDAACIALFERESTPTTPTTPGGS